MTKRPGVAHLPLSAPAALRIVRRLTKGSDSTKVYFLDHATKRMRERRITRPQVLACLQRGTICEGPAPDIKGCWRFTMRHSVAGDAIHVTASLQWDAESSDHVLVVTVFGD